MNLGCVYLNSGGYKDASLYLIEAIRLFDKICCNFVPDRNKIPSFTRRYFESYPLLMSCFLFLGRTESAALLVIDLGRSKELNFVVAKRTNLVQMEMTWNRIKACEEQIEIQEIQQSLHVAKNDSSILVFAIDHKRFLNIWIPNEGLVFRKVDDGIEAIVMLMLEFLEMAK